MKKQSEEISIKELVEMFLSKIWIIALVSIIFAVVFGAYSSFAKEDQYTSTGSYVMVKVPTQYGGTTTSSPINTGLNANEIAAMQGIIGMSERVLKTTEFLTVVKEHLVERDATYDAISLKQLGSMLSIKVVGDATCFDISAVSTNVKLSYDVADVVYNILPDKIENVFDTYAIKLKAIDSPRPAEAPNSKNVVRNAVIGFAGGFLLSVLAIFVINRFDVVIRSRDKIEDNFDIPIIAVIPKLESDV